MADWKIIKGVWERLLPNGQRVKVEPSEHGFTWRLYSNVGSPLFSGNEDYSSVMKARKAADRAFPS